ncbi:MAG TPA: alpha-L-fucosidase [Phycisphaerae bacterium]|nr:alpha-L-fucosidase [Phycisphaerae bacterium]
MKEGAPAERSVQRLTEERLNDWLKLEYGMFIHYGMTTFSKGKGDEGHRPLPIECYAPTDLDVDQWIAVARDAGMKYAILTVQHGTGFCLWPTRYNHYNVANSPCPVDVVEAFVNACRRCGVEPAFYHCGGNDKLFGSPAKDSPARREAVLEYLTNQVTELLTQYGDIAEMWFDGPGQYGLAGRRRLYDHVVGLQPQTVIATNGAFETNGMKTVVKPETWPTDVIVIETSTPPFWPLDRFDLGDNVTGKCGKPEEYYLPTECVMCMDNHAELWWFGGPGAVVRDDLELLAMRLLTRRRGANCVLNVPPTPQGRLRQDYVDALLRLAGNWRKYLG